MPNSPDTSGQTAKPSAWKNLGQRTAIAALLIPVVVLETWAGGVWFEVFIIAVGALMVSEWVAMVHGGERAQFWLHMVAMAVAGVSANHGYLWIAAIVILAAWAASIALCKAADRPLSTWSVVGVPYVCVPVVALIMLRAEAHYGMIAILWVFVVVWLADTLAYFAGKTIGGPKLAPSVSPNKTWAGLGGAVAGGMVGSLLVAGGAGLDGLLILAAIGGLLAVVEQLGDLFESAAKRFYGLKDSGAIIPGHGGVLDRIDGLIAVATAAWVLGSLRMGTQMPASGLLLW